VLASFLAFLAFNFFFVPPLYTLVVERAQDVIELAILLVVGLTIGTLVARARAQAYAAANQADRMTTLYQVSQEISAALAVEQILPRIAHSALRLLRGERARIRLRADDGTITYETSVGNSQASGDGMCAPLSVGGATLGELQVWPREDGETAEDDIRPLMTTLATQAALAVERTRLAEVALQARVLRESERLKGALLSSVSHDLRTPLAVIKGIASNLLDTSVAWDANTTRRFLETVDAEADRLNRLVRNLLEMSRLEAGALSRSRELVAIGDIIGTTLTRLRPLLVAHRTVLSLEPDLPDIEADPVQLELVLTNLLENAAKYAPCTQIDIGAHMDGDVLTLTIGDRGPGIPAADEQRIFEKFFRSGSPDHRPGGSGLGLTIAKGIVEAHGGRIEAHNRNRSGGGAVFTLSLPIRQHVGTAIG
jgi:two-component system sensor histidine kinase KdpD